ncbi:MAG: TrkA C-terminal domain-containing protein [Candidatus Cryptobacteroides sp.]
MSGILIPFKKYPFRQQALVSFVGLRGAASIVFAIMAISGNEMLENDLFNIVFCIVLLSISIQGSLIPLVSKKLKMIDTESDVLRTFNDYSEKTEMQFGCIDIEQGSNWEGKMVMELGLPGNSLIALVLRGEERIIARGDTVLRAGDKAIMVTKTFEDTKTCLLEKKVREGGPWDGLSISDFEPGSLVLLIRRSDQEIIPKGDTILKAGDKLVILKQM